MLPSSPSGPMAAISVETWSLQAWYRDNNPQATSNLARSALVTGESIRSIPIKLGSAVWVGVRTLENTVVGCRRMDEGSVSQGDLGMICCTARMGSVVKKKPPLRATTRQGSGFGGARARRSLGLVAAAGWQ